MDKTLERIFYTLLLALLPQISDHLQTITERQLTRAILDNLTHFLIGVFSWLIIEPSSTFKRSNDLSNYSNMAIVGFLAAFIDLDHFVVAKSFLLSNLSAHRGFLHCSGIMFLTNMFVFCLRLHWGILFIVSWLPHHLRDSSRRGMYLFPPQVHTNPISPDLVNFITIIFPWIITMLRTTIVIPLNQPIRGVFNV